MVASTVVTLGVGLTFATLSSAAPSGCVGGTRPVISVDFDNLSIGSQYSASALRNDFGTDRTNHKFDSTKIVSGYSGSGLQIEYPAGKYGSDYTLWFSADLPSTDEVYISYRVKFQGGFDFKKGGKLPGVCGGHCNTGMERSSGYDGFSSRLMWRDGGRLVSYVYHPGQSNAYGDDYDWGTSVSDGEWVHMSQRVKLNIGKSSDGSLEGWVGNSETQSTDGIMFRKTEDLKIDTFHFVTFFGGGDRSYAPSSAQYAVFDDILVCA
eukprot:comp34021_c0_seq1/m.47295 comp34021_c0_seq1/g.47295  ORF comp34021_c0_seq1/g.47295 comp34021_c0_seq1/m.47295 type:complete len:265 (-) comp34021_c0_seq1:424-1218(-)